jgi:hypothetical protein
VPDDYWRQQHHDYNQRGDEAGYHRRSERWRSKSSKNLVTAFCYREKLNDAWPMIEFDFSAVKYPVPTSHRRQRDPGIAVRCRVDCGAESIPNKHNIVRSTVCASNEIGVRWIRIDVNQGNRLMVPEQTHAAAHAD